MLRVAAVAAALAFLLPPASSSVAQPQPGCTWTIGIMGALSGDYARYGVPAANAVHLAVDQANAQGDLACTLDTHAEDTQGDPNQAPAAADALVSNEDLVACVCGFFSGESLASGAIFSDAGVAMLSTGDHELLSRQRFRTWFRAIASMDVQAVATGVYIKRALDARRVAVVHDNQDYSKRMALQVAKRVGRRFEGPVFVIAPEESDYSAVVAQLRKMKPDAIFYGGYAPQAWRLARQLRQAGVRATFVTDAGAHDVRRARQLYDGRRNASLGTARTDASKVPAAQGFAAAYELEFGYPPKHFAPDTYDVTNIVIDALRQLTGRESTEEVRAHVVAYLDAVEAAQGTVKTYSWDDTGELQADADDVWIWRWNGRRFVMKGRVSELTN